MSIMKIRGGDLDLVEYEFNTFSPGKNIRTVGFEGKYDLEISDKLISVRAPARIHLTVLDMNRFAPDHPGGGGLGFAINVFCDVDVCCTQSGFDIDYNRPEIIEHFLHVFSRTVGYKGGLRVSARDHNHKHVGLGSTSTILIAVAVGINRAVGSPLSVDQIRALIGHNYVEETEDGELAFGFETGVGPAVSYYGGMAILGDDLTLIHNCKFAEDKQVYIVIPPTSISSSGEQEFDVLMNRARTLDYRDREQKAYCVMMDMIPALKSRDLQKIGDVIWEMEFRGSKRAEIEHHSFEIYHYMNKLRKAGIEFVGMSSVGPAIALITDKKWADVLQIIDGTGLSVAIETTVNNTGIEIFEREM